MSRGGPIEPRFDHRFCSVFISLSGSNFGSENTDACERLLNSSQVSDSSEMVLGAGWYQMGL